MIDTILQDLRHAARSLRRTPGFTAAAIVTLALGIGANTAIYSLLHAVVQRPLAVRAPHDLFTLLALTPDDPDDTVNSGVSRIFSFPRFERLRDAAGSRATLAAMSRPTRVTARLAGAAAGGAASAQLVSGEFFATLDVLPAHGRTIGPDDNRRPDGDRVAVVSHRYWQHAFGATWSTGRDLVVNGVAVTVIGVVEPSFSGVWADTPTDIWLPISLQHAIHYQGNAATYRDDDDAPWLHEDRALWLNIVGRASAADRAAIEIPLRAANHAGVIEFLDRTFDAGDEANRRPFLQAQLTLEDFSGGFSRLRDRFAGALRVLMLLVGSVLLVACANIAGLLLVRAAGRRRDVAIRVALGATRVRLATAALAETLFLALGGGAVGGLAGYLSSLALARLALGSTGEPLPPAFGLDLPILAFALAASLAAALLCSLLPAIRAARPGTGTLVDRSPSGSHVLAGTRPLVAVQIALAIVVVMTGGLLLRTLTNLLTIEPGFDRTALLSVGFDAPASGYTVDRMPRVYEHLRNALAAVPGVRVVSFSTCGLIAGCQNSGGYVVDGYQPRRGERVSLQESRVGPDYVAATGMALVEGRDLTDTDSADGSSVALVNEAFVRRYAGGHSPLGRRIGYGTPDATIVGVVRDARLTALQVAPVPMVFRPLAQGDWIARTAVIRVDGDPRPLVGLVRATLSRVEPALVVSDLTPIGEQIARNVTRERLVAYLASTFASLALLLSCVGLYAVLAYGVNATRHDMGVRLALGATPAHLSTLVMADGSRMLAAGIALGLAAAFPAGRLLGPLLFGVTATDVSTIASSVLLLAAVTLTACYLPARRAAAVDPVVALRAE